MYTPTPMPHFPGWFVIPGYSQYGADRQGRILNTKTGYYSKGGNAGRYLKVSVYHEDSSVATLQHVHDLVCRTFKGPPEPGQVVLHKNDRRWDNRPTNLEWGTQSQNIKDTYARGIRQPTYGPRVVNALGQEDFAFTQHDLDEVTDDIPASRVRLSSIRATVTPIQQCQESSAGPIVILITEEGRQVVLSGGLTLSQARDIEAETVLVRWLHVRRLAPYTLTDAHPDGQQLKPEDAPPWTEW